jgi:hypothetical protein
MLYAFAFDRVGVVAGDLYFLDPNPGKGQEGPERGVRVEVRLVNRADLQGSIYSARPITVDEPLWRADLLESVDNPGSFDRTHHHPGMRGWEPSARKFEPRMSKDPVAFVGEHLADLDAILRDAGRSASEVGPTDADELRAAVPEILTVVEKLLARVHAGELALAPSEGDGSAARESWL